jgi:hypothetical protein
MSRQARIPQSDVVKLEKFLENLPDPEAEAVTKRQAIHRLAPRIALLRKRGFTVRMIAEQLSANGLEIKPAVLQKYLSELKDRPPVRRTQLPRVVAKPVAAARRDVMPEPCEQAPRELRSVQVTGAKAPSHSDPATPRPPSGETSTSNRGSNRPPTIATATFTPREDSEDL